MAEHVELQLPLSARYASTVRAVVASVAADAGLSVDEIDDLRLGVNEAISILTDVDEQAAGAAARRLHVVVELDGPVVGVRASRHGVDEPVSESDLDVLATRILTAVVDSFAIDDGAVVLSKRTSGVADASV